MKTSAEMTILPKLPIINIGAIFLIVVLSCASFSYHVFAFVSPDAALIGYSESTIQVFPTPPVYYEPDSYCDMPRVYGTELLVRDVAGRIITETTTGSQVQLEATVTNYCDGIERMLVIFEVRDPNDVTNYLTWQDGTINSSDQVVIGSSWIAPNVPGEYTVRLFNMPPLSSPMILSQVMIYKLVVIAPADDFNS